MPPSRLVDGRETLTVVFTRRQECINSFQRASGADMSGLKTCVIRGSVGCRVTILLMAPSIVWTESEPMIGLLHVRHQLPVVPGNAGQDNANLGLSTKEDCTENSAVDEIPF